MCISVVTRSLDAFDMRYIRVAEYQPVRDVAGCETPWVGICVLGYTPVYTTHNIPGDPPQTEPRLVSHHCALWEFMNWKRIIARALLTTWSLYDSRVKSSTFLGKKFVSLDWSIYMYPICTLDFYIKIIYMCSSIYVFLILPFISHHKSLFEIQFICKESIFFFAS